MSTIPLSFPDSTSQGATLPSTSAVGGTAQLVKPGVDGSFSLKM